MKQLIGYLEVNLNFYFRQMFTYSCIGVNEPKWTVMWQDSTNRSIWDQATHTGATLCYMFDIVHCLC